MVRRPNLSKWNRRWLSLGNFIVFIRRVYIDD